MDVVKLAGAQWTLTRGAHRVLQLIARLSSRSEHASANRTIEHARVQTLRTVLGSTRGELLRRYPLPTWLARLCQWNVRVFLRWLRRRARRNLEAWRTRAYALSGARDAQWVIDEIRARDDGPPWEEPTSWAELLSRDGTILLVAAEVPGVREEIRAFDLVTGAFLTGVDRVPSPVCAVSRDLRTIAEEVAETGQCVDWRLAHEQELV